MPAPAGAGREHISNRRDRPSSFPIARFAVETADRLAPQGLSHPRRTPPPRPQSPPERPGAAQPSFGCRQLLVARWLPTAHVPMAGRGFPPLQPVAGRRRRPGPCVRSRPLPVDKAESDSRLLLVLRRLLVLRPRLSAAAYSTS